MGSLRSRSCITSIGCIGLCYDRVVRFYFTTFLKKERNKKRRVLADYRLVNFLVGRLFDWKWKGGEKLGFVGLLRITGF